MSSLLPPDLLADSRILISGGGSGVNLGIAEVFADLGADLVLCGRTPERLVSAAERLRARGAEVVAEVADVRDLEAVEGVIAKGAEVLGPLTGVVCGAAGNFLAPAESISENGFRAVVDIDLRGSFHCAKAGFEQLRQTRGSVLFVTGGQSRMAYRNQAHVAAAKAGVDQLMRSLALEWGRYGIRCNSIMPGPVAGSEGMRRLAADGGLEPWLASVPLGRLATTREIGCMAAVLMSPLAAFMTGALVAVDGGLDLVGSALVDRELS